MDEDEIDRLLAELGVDLPDEDDAEHADEIRLLDGWDDFGEWVNEQKSSRGSD